MWNSIARYKRTAATLLALISVINFTPLPAFSNNLSPLNIRRSNDISNLPQGGNKSIETANRMLANLPLRFEANRGQADSRFDYVLQDSRCGVLLSSSQALLASQEGVQVRMKLAGAEAAARGKGISELPTRSNYFLSNDPEKWQSNVPNYSKVEYENVYPGISVVYYGNEGELEYDFIVNAGADPATIRLDFEGAKKIRLDAKGDLVLSTAQGEIRQRRPRAYQGIGGVKKELASRYVLKGRHRAGIKVAAFDRSKELIIDPVLSYSTYLGKGAAVCSDIAVDAEGNAYITGQTFRDNFPATAGAFKTPSVEIAVFVMKLSANGNSLIYASYFAGSHPTSYATGIAVDSAGNAYVIGDTASFDFPVTPGAFQVTKPQTAPKIPPPSTGIPSITLEANGFVSKINPTGTALIYSTYLGGDGTDALTSIAVDSTGSAYVMRTTRSTNFPVTAGAFQETNPLS